MFLTYFNARHGTWWTHWLEDGSYTLRTDAEWYALRYWIRRVSSILRRMKSLRQAKENKKGIKVFKCNFKKILKQCSFKKNYWSFSCRSTRKWSLPFQANDPGHLPTVIWNCYLDQKIWCIAGQIRACRKKNIKCDLNLNWWPMFKISWQLSVGFQFHVGFQLAFSFSLHFIEYVLILKLLGHFTSSFAVQFLSLKSISCQFNRVHWFSFKGWQWKQVEWKIWNW